MTAANHCSLSLVITLLFTQGVFAAGQPNQPNANNPGPWDADVIVYHSGSGTKIEKLATFERAGVPTIARMKDGRLIAAHQYFPADDRANFDKVAIHFSADEGRNWTTPEVMQLTGLPEDMRFPFDPTLVPLPDGRIRMYFTSVAQHRDEPALPGIHSAISKNGIDYTYEPGTRFAIEGRSVIDCAVALHNGVFHLYSPDNGAQDQQDPRTRNGPPVMNGVEGVGYHATSKDGLNFTRQADVKIDGRRRWLGNAQSDGKVITFFGTGEPLDFVPTPGQRGGNLWMATSTDGQSWQLIKSPAVMGADPGAITAKDGSLILITTGEPRAGTPSANRMRPAGNDNSRPMIKHPLMTALDTNQDGIIDATEIANAAKALKKLDRDGNGRLTPDELRPASQPNAPRN